MDKLIDVLEVFPTTEITRNVIWNISNLVQLKPLTGKPWEDIKKGFPLLKKIFSDGQINETLIHAIKAVSYLVGIINTKESDGYNM